MRKSDKTFLLVFNNSRYIRDTLVFILFTDGYSTCEVRSLDTLSVWNSAGNHLLSYLQYNLYFLVYCPKYYLLTVHFSRLLEIFARFKLKTWDARN